MLKYFIYCRKSSEDEDRQLLSIDAQYTELNQIAKEKNLLVVGRFEESKSAKEPGREVFNEMLRRIERGEANAILSDRKSTRLNSSHTVLYRMPSSA